MKRRRELEQLGPRGIRDRHSVPSRWIAQPVPAFSGHQKYTHTSRDHKEFVPMYHWLLAVAFMEHCLLFYFWRVGNYEVYDIERETMPHYLTVESRC